MAIKLLRVVSAPLAFWTRDQFSLRKRYAAEHMRGRPWDSHPVAPPLTIFVGRHVVDGLQMPFQHLEPFPVLQTNDVLPGDRPFDRNRRPWFFQLLGRRRQQAAETLIHLPNQLGHIANRHRVGRQM